MQASANGRKRIKKNDKRKLEEYAENMTAAAAAAR